MTLPDALLARVSAFVAEKLGLEFPVSRWKDLERGLRAAASEARIDDVALYSRWLLETPLTLGQLEPLASHLTVGETYFFREPQAFAALRTKVIPEIVASRRSAAPWLRVWSAGCCTGEEAYSIAIFLTRECPELRGWRISILGTDINARFLRKAREAVYRSWSFRGAPRWLQGEFFTPLGGDRYELRADIRQMVTFEHLNLAEDVQPALRHQICGLDLIFCRNVLMYFTPQHVRKAVAAFERCLVEGGHLVVSVCEASTTLAPGWHARPATGATLYQKRSRRASPPRVPRPPEEMPRPFEDIPLMAVTPASEPPPEPSRPSVASRVGRAREELNAGNYAVATTELEDALVDAPLDVEAAGLLARALANQGRLADARRWVDRALESDRLCAPLHYLRATILQDLGELAGATSSLEKALFLEPDFVLAHIALAELLRRNGRAHQAGRHVAHALRVLRRLPPDAPVPEADDLRAGPLISWIEAMQTSEVTR